MLKKQNPMFKKKRQFFLLYLSTLCWAVMWLMYSISFLDIFYALNVVSLWRLDAHWKIFRKLSHLAEVQATPRLRILDPDVHPHGVESNGRRSAEFSSNVEGSVSKNQQTRVNHSGTFSDKFPRSKRLRTVLMLNASDTCNPVTGYKIPSMVSFPSYCIEARSFLTFLWQKRSLLFGQMLTNIVQTGRSNMSDATSWVRRTAKNKSIRQRKEKKIVPRLQDQTSLSLLQGFFLWGRKEKKKKFNK